MYHTYIFMNCINTVLHYIYHIKYKRNIHLCTYASYCVHVCIDYYISTCKCLLNSFINLYILFLI